MRIAAIAVLLLLLAGCEPNQLYLGTRTVVGINAAVNPEQSTGSLVIGYDREFVTVIPRSVDTTAGNTVNGEGRDAMSALVCSNLAVEGITIRRYTESIATGDAARTFAASLRSASLRSSGRPGVAPAAVKDFFDCFRDKPQEQVQPGRPE